MTTFETLRQQLEGIQHVDGITPVDILLLPEDLHAVVRKMLRQTMSLQELSVELMLPLDQAHVIADLLVDRGFLQAEDMADGDLRYKILFARMRSHNIAFDL